MRTLPMVATLALLAAVSCGSDSGTPSAASESFDPDDGCSLAVGPFAISSVYYAREDMLGPPPDAPAPTYEPVDDDVLAGASLPAEVGGLVARSMERADYGLVVFYGDEPVTRGFQSDLTATGGLVVTRRTTGLSDEQSLAQMVELVGDRVTRVQVGSSIGWVSQYDGDHFGAVSKPQQVNWVEGHHQLTVVGVRDPAELVVAARELACGQDS
jgi:hypothetical protein